MKIVIVDNGSRYLSQLKDLLAKHHMTVWPWNRANVSDLEKFDLIILSGGHKYAVLNHRKVYKKEIEVIRNSSIPIIGICLGSELIAWVFGAKLMRLKTPEHGLIAIRRSPGADLPLLRNFKVYESHHWAIRQLSKSLKGLAKSKDGYEIFKHKARPIYGLQFHPEIVAPKSSGKIIFNRILKTLTLAKN